MSKRITELPAVTAGATTDLFETSQGSVSKKISTQQIADSWPRYSTNELPYAQMRQVGTQGLAMPADTPVGWRTATPGPIVGAPYYTFFDGPLADQIVVGTDGGGIVQFAYSLSFSITAGNPNNLIEVFFFINDVKSELGGEIAVRDGEASGSQTVLGPLLAGDTIDLRFEAIGGGVDLLLEVIDVVITRVAKAP